MSVRIVSNTIYIADKRLADSINILGQSRLTVRHINCIKPKYTGSEKYICSNLDYPPLVSRSEPSLLYPTPKGIRLPRRGDYGIGFRTPWGEHYPYYIVPIARYGLLRLGCKPLVGDGDVTLVCYGVPDKRFTSRLTRVAVKLGVVVKIASTRLYSWRTVKEIARILVNRDYIVLPSIGLPHLILAGVRYMVEEMGVSRIPRIYTLFDPSYDSRVRNYVKNAVDYMCSMGDEVACYSSLLFHKPLWRKIVVGEWRNA